MHFRYTGITNILGEVMFRTNATAVLQAIMDTVDAHISDTVDADMQGGILTLELEDGRQYVINLHEVNEEIWLSSPISGAKHFAHDSEKDQWISTRGEEELLGLLSSELSTYADTEVNFR